MNRVKVRLGTLVAAAALAVVLAGCGGSSSTKSPSTSSSAARPESAFAGGTLDPPDRAPELGLRDQNGRLVHTRDFHGKALLVTFVYTHCPDVCPLITENLRAAQNLLGAKATRMAVVAVSVDPKGDTSASVRHFLAVHRMTGRMHYLTGTRPALERVWARWQVAARVPKSDPELVEHSAFVFGVSASGKRTTLYPATGLKAKDIAHDVPLLLAR